MAARRDDPESDATPVDFGRVFNTELEHLRLRRGTAGRAEIEKVLGRFPDGNIDAGAVLNAVGLSLSGGGIRSASFCLGVLQALDRRGVLKRLDYLSTVSGGGYIGSSLSSAMSHNGGKFPFGNGLQDSASVAHIRNHSNYLMPHGKTDVLE